MKVIIVTIDENGNVKIDTNKVDTVERSKYITPIVEAIGDVKIKKYYSPVLRTHA